jgi:hypothetical protein
VSTFSQTPSETVVPRTERSLWQAIADALNAAEAAGMAVGIDLDGTLTDRHSWSVVWDRDAKQWVLAGCEDIVAYRNPVFTGILLCREHGRGWRGLIPLTAEELPEGGICNWGPRGQECGRDVLIAANEEVAR